MLSWQDRRWLPLQIGELVHVVVERRKHSVPGIAQHLVEATFLSLAGKEGNAERLGLAHVLRHFRQHGDAA